MVSTKLVLRRATKYATQCIIVALVAYHIPNCHPRWSDIVIIAMTAGITFSILDMLLPSVPSVC